MKKTPLNTDNQGNASTILAGYYKYGVATLIGGACKTIFARLGRLSWENYLGRLEHGGRDCQMTSILEIYEDQ